MLFLAELSDKLLIPSEFRLLNGAHSIMVGLGEDDGQYLSSLRQVMQKPPGGKTPLCKHITAIVHRISSIERELRANNQKAVVVIATDGEATDGDVAQALEPLAKVR